MNWIRNFIIRLLRIEPARDKKIVIKEPLSYQANVLKNKILYRGDPAEIEQFFKSTAAWDVEKTRFWASVSQGSVRKMHSGIVSVVIDRYRDIVMADLDNIDFGESKNSTPIRDIWEKIVIDNKLFESLGKAVTGALVCGDGAFKISTEPDIKYPIIEFFDSENVEFIKKHGRTIEIRFYTTYHKGSREYRLEEIYSKGSVSYRLFDQDGREVELNTLEETKDLSNVTFDGNYMMAVPIQIFPSNKYKGRGKALFDGKTDTIDGLDEVISQWLDAVRLGRIKRYIPDNLIPRDPDTGKLLPANPFDNDFIAIGENLAEDGKSQIEVSQPQISYEAYVNSYANFLDMVLQGIISPSTLGIDLKKTDNAESQREKEKVTLHVRNKIVDTLNEAIPQLASITMKTYDIMQGKTPEEYEPSVKFGEYASPDFDSTVEIVGKARSYGIMSIETSVNQLYGDTWTQEEKENEILRLKEEQGIIEIQEPSISADAKGESKNEDENSEMNISNKQRDVSVTTQEIKVMSHGR